MRTWVRQATKAGKLISCDVNLRLMLWESEAEARKGILEGLKRAAVVKLSDDELEFLTSGTSTGDIRSQLWHDGLKLVVLSHGAQDAIAITERGEQAVPRCR